VRTAVAHRSPFIGATPKAQKGVVAAHALETPLHKFIIHIRMVSKLPWPAKRDVASYISTGSLPSIGRDFLRRNSFGCDDRHIHSSV
jgi:hypothetical protein